MPSPQLPEKDQARFKELLRAYEHKKLAEGRKLADQLLKKHPHNGEIMSMKGVILVHLGERDAGIKLAKAGTRQGLQSHVCWHIWGLIQRGEHNYDGSLAAFLQAIKLDQANYGIMREISVLQTHLRQYDGLLETRFNMLRLRSNAQSSWLALAVTHWLLNNLQEAKHVLETFEGFLRDVPPHHAEYGEYFFFYVRVLEDLGELQEALSLLDEKTKKELLADRNAILVSRTRLFAKLKSTAEADSAKIADWTEAAETSWRELIDVNPDSHDYYKGFLANAGIDLANLTDESRAKALGILEEFSCKHPKATASLRLALTIAQGEKFKELAKPYLERALQKGIPSLFSDVKNLYTDSDKLLTIQAILEDFRKRVSPKQPPESSEPTDYLWSLYFLAQHYSFLGQQLKALEILSNAINHTPTLPELYMMKARVFKRAGDPYGAVRAMDESCKLDGQDRFLNSKSGKYRLRAGMIAEAVEVFGLFTKKGMQPGVELLEVQALHYLRELGDAQRRLGRYNLALKTYYNIQKVFTSFRIEQLDFHVYSLRHAYLATYIDMLNWEDNLLSHPTYIHAAVWTARIWIKLYDDPSLIKSLQSPEPWEVLSKKALNKAKKAALKAFATHGNDDNPSKAPAKKNEDRGIEAPPPKDEDPDGLKLVSAEDPLARANEFLSTLEVLGKDNVDVNVTLFDVAIRQKKYLKAVRALRRAYAREPQHPEVHVRIVQFAPVVASIGDGASEMVKSVIEEAFSVMKSTEVSLERFNSEYLQLNSKSVLAVLACAKASQFMDAPREEVENLLFTTLAEGVQLCVADALEILEYLQQIQSPRANEFRIACDTKFVLSNVFKSAEEQAVLRRELVAKDENETMTDETIL